MLKRIVVLMMLSWWMGGTYAADHVTDSLLNIINTSRIDSVLMKTHYELLKRLKHRNPGAAVEHGKLALAYAQKGTDKHLLGKIHNNLGTAYGNLGSTIKAYDHYMRAYKTHLSENDSVAAYIAWYNIGLMKSDEDLLNEAMKYYMDARRVFEMYNDTNNMVLPIMGTGAVYAKLGKYKESLQSFLDAKKIIERTRDVRKMSTCLNNIASTYAYLGEHQKSYETFKESMELHRAVGDEEGIAMVMFNMSSPLKQLKRYDEALRLLDSSILISKTKGYMHNLTVAYQNKAELLIETKKYDEAEKFLWEGIALARDFNEGDVTISYYKTAHNLYKARGDYKKALEYFTLAKELEDSLVNKESVKVGNLEREFSEEMKQKEISLLNKEKELEEVRTRNTRVISILVVAALAVVIFIGYQRYRSKQKSNRELQRMNAIIAQKNKDITDSITYASRIQQAILPEKEVKYRLFPDAFVLLLPRDLVSGDFYWFAEKNGQKIIAAVDCTGHGVPGAFMSMIGNAYLNQIVMEEGETRPDLILNKLRDKVKHALKQQEADDASRDGMDAAICAIDTKTGRIRYAGANNPLWIFPKNGEFREVKPDKAPVALSGSLERPFSLHEVKIEQGDMIYIFSDGFADQFGGGKNKKMTNKKFRELIREHAPKPALEQERIFRDYFTEWKGSFEQTDDVLVIGIRI